MATTETMTQCVLSEREAATWLGISTSRLRAWARVNGIFPPQKRFTFFQKCLYPMGFLQSIVQSTQKELGSDAPAADDSAKPATISEVMEEILKATTLPDGDDKSEMETAPIVRMCNAIIVQAMEDRASDVYIEPSRNSMRVRMRIDGVLQEKTAIPNHIKSMLTNRYKVMAEIPYFRKTPQSGSIGIRHGDTEQTLYLTFAPTLYGDSIHISFATLPEYAIFPKLGMLIIYERELRRICEKKEGLLLIFGGVGQGKSKLSHSLLWLLNDPEIKIVALQPSSEHKIVVGVTHLLYQKSPQSNFKEVFDAALHLRPNILALDIVDIETAEAAVSAAEKGVQVIATITTTTFAHCQRILEQAGIDKARQKSVFAGAIGTRLMPKQHKEDAKIGMEGVGLIGVYEIWQEYDNPALIFEDDISLKRMEGLIA
jgi:type II secretory ATPase GspE/PulE/Tfp pilus assembly ATPase PilB-like protein